VLVNYVKILLLSVTLVGRPCCLLLCKWYLAQKMEQRINSKFSVKLRAQLSVEIPYEDIYGEVVMSRTQIFELHKCFENGCEKAEDNSKSG